MPDLREMAKKGDILAQICFFQCIEGRFELEQVFLQTFSPTELEKKWDGNLNKFEILDKKYEKFFLDSVTVRMESLF